MIECWKRVELPRIMCALFARSPVRATLTMHKIESSRRTIKRIRLHVDDLRSNEQPQSNEEVIPRPSSPDKDSRIPQRTAPAMVSAFEFSALNAMY
jgi:hypothetical protein